MHNKQATAVKNLVLSGRLAADCDVNVEHALSKAA